MVLPLAGYKFEIAQRMPDFDKGGDKSVLATQVARYLHKMSDVLPQLQKLELEMKQEVNTRLKVLPNTPIDLKDKQFQFGQKLPHMRNVLTTVLSRVEVANGFEGKHTNPLLLVGFVSPDEFRPSVLQTKRPFKDPGVPDGHGEFSHRIQWYCLMKSALTCANWGDFYKWVGSKAHTTTRLGDLSGWKDLGLWDALFDRVPESWNSAFSPYTAKDGDLRCPENLHKAITITHAGTLPLLSTFLALREQKRVTQKFRNDDAAKRDYVIKKVFTTRKLSSNVYANLQPTEKTEIDKLLVVLQGP